MFFIHAGLFFKNPVLAIKQAEKQWENDYLKLVQCYSKAYICDQVYHTIFFIKVSRF